MIADMFVIRKSPKYGQKGLFATQFIPKGTLIDFRCRKCRTYSREELARLPKKQREFIVEHEVMAGTGGAYTKFCDKRQLYENHSCNANILNAHVSGCDNGGIDIAVRDIKKGEEATTDYRLNDDETVHFTGGCKCGAKNCMKNTTFKPPALKELQRFWDRKINAAIKRIPYTKQPLKGELLRENPGLSYFFKGKRSLHSRNSHKR